DFLEHRLILMLMATELDPPPKLSSPRIFLLRMLVFVALCAAVVFVLHKQIEIAFMANPALNSLIIFVLIVAQHCRCGRCCGSILRLAGSMGSGSLSLNGHLRSSDRQPFWHPWQR